jgi:FtsH-binding integral membrane protein
VKEHLVAIGSAHNVWKRTGRSTISRRLFAFATAMFTLLGLLVSFGSAQVSKNWQIHDGWQTWAFAIGVFVVAMLGIVLAMASDNPAGSLLGYAMVAIPFGLLLGPVLQHYSPGSIVKAAFITSAVVFVLGVVGAMIPDDLRVLGSVLASATVILVFGLFLVPLAGFLGFSVHGALTLWEWVGIVIFCGWVVVDWNRAMRVPATVDNAIDCAIAVYLDWVNLFLFILSLTGDDD